MGRPSKLSPERQAKIVTALRAGNYRLVASQYAGIDYGTFTRWLAQGLRDSEAGKESDYSRFRVAVTEAETVAEIESVAHIKIAGGQDWRAAAHYLERKHPERWGKTDRIELSGRDGGPIELTQAEVVKQASEIVSGEMKQLTERSVDE